MEGVTTTAPLHQALVADDAVRAGDFHTKFLEQWLEREPLGVVQKREVAG